MFIIYLIFKICKGISVKILVFIFFELKKIKLISVFSNLEKKSEHIIHIQTFNSIKLIQLYLDLFF